MGGLDQMSSLTHILMYFACLKIESGVCASHFLCVDIAIRKICLFDTGSFTPDLFWCKRRMELASFVCNWWVYLAEVCIPCVHSTEQCKKSDLGCVWPQGVGVPCHPQTRKLCFCVQGCWEHSLCRHLGLLTFSFCLTLGCWGCCKAAWGEGDGAWCRKDFAWEGEPRSGHGEQSPSLQKVGGNCLVWSGWAKILLERPPFLAGSPKG